MHCDSWYFLKAYQWDFLPEQSDKEEDAEPEYTPAGLALKTKQ